MKYRISHEYFPFNIINLPVWLVDMAGRLDWLMTPPMSLFFDRDLSVRRKRIAGYLGESIEVIVIEPKDVESPSCAMVYYHGGGFSLGATWHHYDMARMYAKCAKCKVIFPQYRLAPRYPYPYGPEDCYAALKYTYDNADSLGIDRTKIGVGGDSAGGALCAATVQMARDRGLGIPLFQMLIYPVIDRRMTTDSMTNYLDTPMWNARLSRLMWRTYLGDGEHENIAYASPIEAHSLEGLSDAYVETAEFDCLRDEGIAYALALRDAGVSVTLNETFGTMHSYDAIKGASESRRSFDARINYMKKRFSEE